MSLNAKFTADFSSFQDAVVKAEISLRSFETGAAKVEGALNKMGDSFSGRRVVQEATLMSEAIERAGGISTLTAKELQNAGAKAAEAAEKMKLLGIDVPPHMQKLADSVQKSGGFFTDLKDQVTGTALGFVSAQAVIGVVTSAFHALTAFVGDSVHAFADAEMAQVQLTAALKQTGQAAPEVIAKYNDLAAQFQRTTVFSDDLITSMEGLLVQVGGVLPQQMQAALQAATDLSAGLGIDLRSATLLVAKAFASGGEDLGRLKAVLGDAVPAGADMAQVLEAINSKFGGQATAQIETYTGQITQAKNAWNNFQETVGKVVVQSDLVQAAIITINAKLSDDADMAAAAAKEQGYFGQALADLANGDLIAASRALGEYTTAVEANMFVIRQARILNEEYNKSFERGAAQLPSFAAAYDQLTKSTQGIDSWIQTLSTDTASLTARQKEQIVTLVTLGASASEVADHFNVTALAVQHVMQAHRDAEAAAKAQTVAHQQLVASMKVEVGTINDIAKVLGFAAEKTEIWNTDLRFTSETIGELIPQVKEMSDQVKAVSSAFAGLQSVSVAQGDTTNEERIKHPATDGPDHSYLHWENPENILNQRPVNVPITVNGSMLGTQQELARAVNEAVTFALRTSGMRFPSGA